MSYKRYKPLLDKLFYGLLIFTSLILIILTVLSLGSLVGFLITLLADLFTLNFIISPLFGYVELREKTVFIKFGFFLKREIEYSKIRGIEKKRQFYSDSLISLKNALSHINIKYNKFDLISVSIVNDEDFTKELEKRIYEAKSQ